MPTRQIARITVKETSTSTEQEVDVYTVADAVETEDGDTLQDKVDALDAHISNEAIHSKASLKIIPSITIPATGWVAAVPVDGSEYAMTVDVTVQGVLESHMPVVALDVASLAVATECGLCPTVQSLANTLRFWARETPSAAMTGTLSLFGEGGISGDFDT